MKILSNRVLIVTAHPDDAELGMGMRAYQHILDGDKVDLLIASNGEHSESPQGRKQEALEAASLLQLDSVEFLELPCGRLDDHRHKLRGEIETIVRSKQPDLLYAIFPHDLHVDHQAVSEESLAAGRSIPSLLFFRVAYSRKFNPNFFFFGTPELLKRKIDALNCYKGEVQRKGALNLEVVENLNKHEMNLYFHHKALSKIQNSFRTKHEEILYFEPFVVERISNFTRYKTND